ncbi:MAG: hypothetical protein KTR30_06350 [Saprospiraceae bacterium]|nr:hypothetical protein [Saprospiraceae bacterium]
MKNINWLNHLVEFVVVILGILIAFQMSTCAETQSQKKLIKEHLENIKSETKFNQRNIKGALELAESSQKKLDSMFVILSVDSALTTVNNFSLALLNIGGVYIKRNAYRSLTESGDIRYIRDFKLKNEIVNLYEYYEWVKGIDEIHVNVYDRSYFPYILKNFDLVEGKVQSAEVYRSKDYKNILSSYRFFLVNRIKKYKDCQEQMEGFLNHLKEEV